MSLISLNQLNMALNAMKQKMKSFRGNWEQNDPTADDYIRNRPFYSECITKIIVPETIVSFETVDSPYVNPFSVEFVVGEEYVVTWDGSEYMCTAYIAEGPNSPSIGNGAIVGAGGGNDAPFFCAVYSGTVMLFSSDYGEHRISISTNSNIIHQIDKKYVPIPDGVVTEEDLNNQLSAVAFTGSYYNLSDTPALSTVATSGNYSDLTNLPEIPEQEQSNLSETDTTKKSYVKGVIRQESLPEGYPYVTYEVGELVGKAAYTLTVVKDKNGNLVSSATAGGVAYYESMDYSSFVANQKYILKAGDNIRLITFVEGSYQNKFLLDDGSQFGHDNTLNTNMEWRVDEFISVFNLQEGTYETGIYYANRTYQTIDEQYLPDTVATTSDVEEISSLVGDTAVSEQIGAAISGIKIDHVQSDWSSLDVNSDSFIQNKPFGYRPDVVPLDTYSFVKIDGTNTYAYMKGNNTNIFDFEGEGVEYVVEWGGQTYTCTSKTTSGTLNGSASVSSTITGVGDASKFVFGGLPFTPSDPVDEYPFFISSSGIFTFSSSESRVVRVYLKDNIVKIDSKFLPDDIGRAMQSDWNETDETASSFILNKPEIPGEYNHPSAHPASMITGLAPAATRGSFSDLLNRPFCDLKPVLEEDNLPFSPVYDQDLEMCAYQSLYYFDLVKGETYKVMWDGEEYLCKCRDIEEDIGSSSVISCPLYLGRLRIHPIFSIFAAEVEDTSEPFLITVAGTNDTASGSTIYISGTAISTHTVSITPVNSIKKLDEKYLPDTAATKQWVREFAEEALADLDISGGSGGAAVTETDYVPEQELQFVQVNNAIGAVVYASEIFVDQDIVEGEEYIVVWDGTEWPVNGVMYEQLGGTGLGNPSLLGLGDDNGKPFAIGVSGTNDSGELNLTFVSADTEPTHTIRIYQKADLKVSWDNVTDKPFYEETYSVTADSTTVKEDVTFEGLGETWTKVSDDTLPKGTVVGATVTATSAGATLNLEVTQDSVIVDNDNGIGCLLGGQIPLLMIYIPGEITFSALGTTETVNIPETGTYMVDIPEGESLTIESKSVKKIDDKFQHQTDWEEDSDESAAFMRNKPFGVTLSAGDVVVEHDAVYDYDDFGLLLSDLNTGESYVNRDRIKVGASYSVQCGDYNYTGIGITSSEIYESIEVEALGGIVIGDIDGEIVAILLYGYRGIVDCIIFRDMSTFEDGSTYPVKVTVAEEVVKTIDPKYLPGPPEFDLTAMGLPAVTLDGQYVTVETDTSAIRTAAAKGLVKTTLILGNVEIESISTLAYITAADIYSSTSMAVLSNLPYVIEFIVSDTTIMARAIALGGSSSGGCLLPEVTTDDNGKFAQVVDGAWSAVEVQDVSEVGL